MVVVLPWGLHLCVAQHSLNRPETQTSAFLTLPCLQYEVRVTGVTAGGLQTAGSNSLFLTLPLGLKLTTAKATGATTVTAVATAVPADAFTKVRSRQCMHVHALEQAMAA